MIDGLYLDEGSFRFRATSPIGSFLSMAICWSNQLDYWAAVTAREELCPEGLVEDIMKSLPVSELIKNAAGVCYFSTIVLPAGGWHVGKPPLDLEIVVKRNAMPFETVAKPCKEIIRGA